MYYIFRNGDYYYQNVEQSSIFTIGNQYMLLNEYDMSEESDYVRLSQKILPAPIGFVMQSSLTCSPL